MGSKNMFTKDYWTNPLWLSQTLEGISDFKYENPDNTFSTHFIQLQIWYTIAVYCMFLSFFFKSLMMLKKYGKMFSIYSFFIIGVMNCGFLIRAIIYNTSLVRYAATPFEEI